MPEAAGISGIIRRVVAAIVLIGIGAIVLKDCSDDRNRDAERAEARRQVQEQISSLQTRHGASANWQRQLCGDQALIIRPIMSFELEQAWVMDSPILFFGTISDIASASDSEYRVELDQSIISAQCRSFDTDLRLRLDCPRTIVDELIGQSPDILTEILHDVAVIAMIERIESERLIAQDGYVYESRIGVGSCLAVIDAEPRAL